jgi:hypothetical protein
VTTPHNLTINNHRSISDNVDVVRDKICSELVAGRMAGPFDSPPFEPFFVSPLKLIPKRQQGEYRLILNLSYPFYNDMSINAGIDPSQSRVVYEGLDDALDIVHKLGHLCFIAKDDLCHAFKLLPVHPACYWMLGFQFEGKFYFDKTMVMGASSSCADFERLSCALQWIMTTKLGVTSMSHILDDFMFFASSEAVCLSYQKKFALLCRDLNLPIKQSKTVPPNTCVELHGVLVNTVTRMVSLPRDKLIKAVDMLRALQHRRTVTLCELQSCIGFLNFACKCVDMARPFLRRLIDLTMGVSRPRHHIRLTREARRDIATWLAMLCSFNGSSLMKERFWTPANSLRLYSDASNSGYAVVYGSRWAYGEWPDGWKQYHITIKEMYPLALAVHLWGGFMSNSRVLFMTDNEAVAKCVQKQSSKEPHIMALIRWMVVGALKCNILFSAKHIPGYSNVVADRLSRLLFSQARELAPWLQGEPEQVPVSMLPSALL